MRFLSKVSLMRNLDIFTKLEKMWLSSDGVLICWSISNIKWRIKTEKITSTRWCLESQPRYLSIITPQLTLSSLESGVWSFLHRNWAFWAVSDWVTVWLAGWGNIVTIRTKNLKKPLVQHKTFSQLSISIETFSVTELILTVANGFESPNWEC